MRVTTVTAGAGFGKTTLVVQAVESLGMNYVWYGLDPSDADLVTFLDYLRVGLGEQVIKTTSKGEDAGKKADERMPIFEKETLLRALILHIENNLREELLIVLDDFHHIQGNHEILQAMVFLLDFLPANIHFVLIGRSSINVPLSRLRAMRQVLDILEEDLVFTPEEVHRLFTEVLRMPMEPEALDALHGKTRGWVSGLILYYHSLWGKPLPNFQDFMKRLEEPQETVFQYFEENLFAPLPGEIKDFLIRTSILSRLNAGFCNRFLEVDNSQAILRELKMRHLFTYETGEQAKNYSYHALFRSFLISKLKQDLNRSAIEELYEKAGILMEEAGLEEEALEHYLQGSRIKEAGAILSRIGRRLIMEGRLQRIRPYIHALPDMFIRKDPWLQFVQAQSLQIGGKSREAVKIYRKTLEAFRRRSMHEGEILCLMDLGRNAFMKGDFRRAAVDFRRLLKQDLPGPELLVEMMGYMIIISAYRGKTEEADRYFQEALERLAHEPRYWQPAEGWLKIAYGFRLLFSGDFQKGLKMGKEAGRAIEPLGLYRLQAMSHQVISTALFFMGRYEEGLEQAENGLDTARRNGLLDNNLAWLLICASLNTTGLGNPDKGTEYAEKALDCFLEQSSGWGQAYAHYSLYYAFRMNQQLDRAEENALKGLKAVQGLALPIVKGELQGRIADCFMERKKFEEALPFLRDARKSVPDYPWLKAQLELLYAKCQRGIDQEEKALEHLSTFLKISGKEQVPIAVMAEQDWLGPLLVTLFSRGHFLPLIPTLFREMEPKAALELQKLRKNSSSKIAKAASVLIKEIPDVPAIPLRARLFGTFQVWIGDVSVPQGRWKSRKAKTLFKHLACFRSRGFQGKEILMELLWPEEDPRKSAKRFHVALASLRKTLEPHIPRGTPSSYIRSLGDAYWLDCKEKGLIDLEKFREALKNAEEAATPEEAFPHLIQSSSLYVGDLCEDDPYAEWCSREREKLKEEFLSCLRKIMDHCEKLGDNQRCVDIANRYLRTDPYAEEVYRRLMTYHANNGNRSGIVKTFEKCRQNLLIGLECPLSAETELLYRKLMSP